MLYGQLDTVQYRLTQLERRHYAQVPVLSGCCKHGGLSGGTRIIVDFRTEEPLMLEITARAAQLKADIVATSSWSGGVLNFWRRS